MRFIPGNRYPGMWSASIQCRVGMNAKLVGKTLKTIDSKIGAANRELKAGAADDERAQLATGLTRNQAAAPRRTFLRFFLLRRREW